MHTDESDNEETEEGTVRDESSHRRLPVVSSKKSKKPKAPTQVWTPVKDDEKSERRVESIC